MKKFENISEFENLLKDQLGGHSTPPPADVWTNVAASTTAQSASILSQVTGFLGSTTNLVKVALFAGGIAAAGIAIYNENRSSNTAENSSTPNSEQPKVESVLADSAESISKIDYQTTTITADNTKSEPIDSKSSESSTSTKTETNSNGLVNNNPNQSSSDINRADVKSTMPLATHQL